MAEKVLFRRIEDYFNELNRKAFRSGVDRAIRHTQETGFETGFNISFQKKDNLFIYPYFINVGEKNEVIPGNYDFETIKRVKNYCQLKKKNFSELFEEITTNKYLTPIIEYPTNFLEANQTTLFDPRVFDNKENYRRNLELITFHTHPYVENCNSNSKEIGISSNDLKALNCLRKINSLRKNSFQIDNPICVVVKIDDISKIKKKFSYLIFQEKKNKPIPSSFNFDQAKIAFEMSYKEAFFFSIFKDIKIMDYYNLVEDNYNIIRGDYIIGKGFYI